MKTYCQHCGLINKNPEEKFCCNGCAAAYRIINNLGLTNYYQTRLLSNKIKALKPEENGQIDVSEFANQTDENSFAINLMIEGLHCAACVWLIENVLKKQAAVKKARINMSTKRLYLEWLGAKDIGNDLVKLIFNLGYRLVPFDAEFLQAAEKKYDGSMLKALAVAGFASGNVMLISVALWANSSLQMGVATRNLLYWVSALIALPAIIYSGRIFVISAFKSIGAKRMNMDVPIAVAIFLASIISIFEAITKGEHAYFDSVIMLIFFLLIGRYLDFSARRKAFSITGDLMMLAGISATIILDGKHKIIASKDLQKDMILNVAMGERIAADGLIMQGESEIDTSVITGESNPKNFKTGDEVFAGMVNLGNALQVKIIKAREETLLAKIVAMVEQIETSKNYYTKIADAVSKYYTPIVHLIALITFIIWCAIGIGWHHALLNAAAVLIITCPCALALAVPVVQIVAAGRLLKQGILIKNGEALERLNKVDMIVFDKTGTLTIGKPRLVVSDESLVVSEDIIQIAASMAAKSKHPLSRALAENFKGELLDLKVQEIPGMGLVADYNNEEIRLGSSKFINNAVILSAAKDLVQPDEILRCAQDDSVNDNPQIYFKYQNQITTFTFQDQLRSDAQSTIKQLRNYNLILLSGDKESVVKSTAKQLGIAEYYFEKTPDQKLAILKTLKSKNKNILMVGDGINDAPSLMLADVSISPSSAADISKNIADIIFQSEKLQPILETIQTAKKSNQIIKQNLAFALVYNLIAVPFAIMGYVVPLFAALAMSSSSIVVVVNALRIRK
ncbi:MAG: heavy metal translocating P-type ATPase metal-binding domain-containing protein [Pseudomonadota bacterium]